MSPVFAFFFGLLALASATNMGFIPVGKEMVYEYYTDVTTGTETPVQVGSRFFLKCKLHVQGLQDDRVGFRMTDLMYRLDNGKIVAMEWEKLVYLPLPAEATELTLPFTVQYDATGKVVAFHADTTDKEWSTNIKRAISNIFQFDKKILETKHNDFLMVPEETIYGLCDIKYVITPFENELDLYKTLDPMDCKQKHMTHMKMYPEIKKTLPKTSFFAANSNRRYKMMMVDGVYRMTEIIAAGGLVYGPYKARSEVEKYITIQKFFFNTIADITEPIKMTNDVEFKGLKIVTPNKKCHESATTMIDFFGGRSHVKMDVYVPQVFKLLDEAIDFIDMNHINMKSKEPAQVFVVNRLTDLLRRFDVAHYEQMFSTLYEKKDTPKGERKMKMFIQVLPFVGTRTSVVFMRNLIRKDKVTEDMALHMMIEFPLHLRCPSEKLLLEIEDMLTMVKDTNSKLYRACNLAFTHVVSHVYTDLNDKSEMLEKYIMMFIEKMKTATDHNLKLMYIYALGNIRNGAVLKHLEPFLIGEEKVNKEVLVHILWAITPRMLRDYHLMAKYILPIFANRRMDVELRIVAYNIMLLSTIDTSKFLTLHWFMVSEPNELLYTYHYNTLQSLAHSKIEERASTARLMVRISRKPVQMSHSVGTYVKYMNSDYYGYDGWTETMLFNTRDTFNFYGSLGMQTRNVPLHLLGIHLRFHGLDGKIRHDFMKHTLSAHNLTPDSDIFKKLHGENDFHVELMVTKAHKVVMTYCFDKTNIKDIVKIFFNLQNLEKDFTSNSQYLQMPITTEFVGVNDFGLTTVMFDQLPILKAWKINFHKEIKDDTMNIHMNMRFKFMANRRTGIKFYNPINDLWHGTARLHNFALSFPINMDMSFNLKTFGNLRMVFNKVQHDDIIGFQKQHETYTFIKGLETPELLHKFNENAKLLHMVSRGPEYMKTMIADKEDHFFGRKVEMGYFDCEHTMIHGHHMSGFKDMMMDRVRNIHNMYTSDFLNMILSFHLYVMNNPEPGQCGYAFRMIPSVAKPVERTEMIMRFKREKTDEAHAFLPEMKVENKFVVTHKSADDKTIRTFDTTIDLEFGKDHMSNLGHMIMLKTEEGLTDFKCDFSFKSKYDVEKVNVIAKMMVGEVDKMGVIDMTVLGTWSEEQKKMLADKTFEYPECVRDSYYQTKYWPRSFECMVKANMYHHYKFDIKVNDMENYYVRQMMNMKMKNFMMLSKYMHDIVKKDITDKNHINIDVIFSLMRREVDYVVETPYVFHKFLGVPTDLHVGALMANYYSMRNAFFSNHFKALFHWGYLKTCIAATTGYMNGFGEITKEVLSDDWVLFAEFDDKEKYYVYVKKVDGKHKHTAMKIVMDKDEMEIIPTDDKCTCTVNGKPIELLEHGMHVENFFYYYYSTHPHMLMIATKKFGWHFEIDGQVVRMHYPFGMFPQTGKCFV